MLERLRHVTSTWIFKILFLVLLLSFSSWGISDFFRNSAFRQTDVAMVGNTDIPAAALDQAYRENMMAARRALGPKADEQKIQSMNILGSSLDRLIRTTLLRLASQDAGLRVSDERIALAVAQDSIFQNAQGRFDPQRYRAVLQANGLTESQFADTLRQNLSLQALLGFVSDNTSLPEGYAKDLALAQGHTRDIDIIYLAAKDVKDLPTPSASDVENFYGSHTALYTKPEYRGISVVDISPGEVAKTMAISDEELRQAYTDRQAEFHQPEKRDIVQALVPDEKTAQKIVQEAQAFGGDLNKAAAKNNAKANVMNKISRGDLPEELAKPFFAQAVNTLGGPLESPLGWHIFQTTHIYPEATLSFEDVKVSLAEDMKKTQAEEQVDKIVRQIQDALAGGEKLSDLARDRHLPLISASSITAQEKSESWADKPQVLATAFALGEGETSDVIQEKNGHMYLVHVDSITPASLISLADVRAKVVENWQMAEQQKILRQKAAEVQEKWAHTDAGKMASVLGGTYATAYALKPDSPRPAHVSTDLMNRLFQLPVGGMKVSLAEDGLTVVSIRRVNLPTRTADASALTKIQQDQKQKMTDDMLAQYEDALRQRYPVVINHDVVNQLSHRGE